MADIKPIKTKADHEQALAEIEELWGSAPGTAKGDRLDVLATLVEVFEEKHFPMELPDPIEAIRFRMEQLGYTRKDLEGVIGGRGRIAEVLSGRRSLSLAMIRKLNSDLGIPAEVLIGAPKGKAA